MSEITALLLDLLLIFLAAKVAAELYDLHADPAELCNLAVDRPELVAELRAQLEQEGRARDAVQRMTAEEEAVIRDRLQQLGYVD